MAALLCNVKRVDCVFEDATPAGDTVVPVVPDCGLSGKHWRHESDPSYTTDVLGYDGVQVAPGPAPNPNPNPNPKP